MLSLALGASILPVLPAIPAGAADALPTGSPYYLKTNGPTTGLAAGDWYTAPTAAGGGGTSHYVTFDIPCAGTGITGWPSTTNVYVDIFSPEINTAAGTPDTVTGSADSFEFELYDPTDTDLSPGAGVTGTRQIFSPTSASPDWWPYAQIFGDSTERDANLCGRYVVRTANIDGDPLNPTGGTDDRNAWLIRVGTDNDLDWTNTPPSNSDNLDGIPGTGDEITIGTSSAAVQQSSGGTSCLTLYEFVGPGLPSVTFHNFGMGGGRVRYYGPSDAYDPTGTTGGTAGTVSGSLTWNNSATTARGGDVVPTPENGWWREVYCGPSGSQFVPEGRTSTPAYGEQPPTPRLTATADDGVTTVARGDTRTTTITVTNTASGATAGSARDVVIRDAIPAGESFVSCSWVAPATGSACSLSGGTVSATLTGELDAGASARLRVVTTVGPTAAGTLTHSVSAPYEDRLDHRFAAATTTESDTVVTADLSVSVTDAPDPVLAGTSLTYTVSTSNAGPDAAPGTSVTLALPAGLTVTGATGAGWSCTTGATVTCTRATPLPTGTAPAITVTADVTASGGTLTATATATSNAADPVTADNTATAGTTVNSAADLGLTKTHIGSFTAGSTGSYLLTVTNSGPSPANPPTTVVDTLPTGLTYVAASGSGWVCSASGQVVSCTRTTPLASGASSMLILTVDVAASTAASVTNTATVSSASTDPDGSNNTATDVTTVDNSGIAGTVWDDVDGDGTRDAGEPALGGRTVTASGPVTRTTTAAADGTYAFVGLVPGTYSVSVSAPSKYVFTTTSPLTITLAADERVTAADFGLRYQNLPPVAANDAKTTTEDAATTVSVLANDSDPDGDAITVTGRTNGTSGAVTCTSTTCTYTPDPNANGTDTFTYTVSDPDGATSTATVTVTITPVNDAPVYTAATANTSQTVPVGGTLSSLAATDPDADPLTYTVVGGALPPTVTLNPDGSFSGGASPHGTYSVQIRVSDGNGGTATTTLSIQVGGPTANTPPAPANDTATTLEDNAVTVNVLANDTDVDDDVLKVSAKTNGALGTVSCTLTTCTYTPAANANGTDTFTYTVTDGIATATATVTVTVTAVNDPPVYTAASTNTAQTVPVGGSLSSLAATDVDLDPLTYSLIGGSLPPGITLTPGGGLTGTANAPGAYSAQIRVSDGNGGTDVTTLAIQVGGPTANTPPEAANDSATTAEDNPVNVGVVANDSDVDLDTLTVTGHTNGTFGTVSCTSTTCTYTPGANFAGSDSFTYTIADGSGGTDTGTVAITVTPVNDPPKYTSAARNTAQTVPVGSALQALSATDIENDTLSYALVSGTLPPGVTLTSAGGFAGTANAPGVYTVVIRVSDGNGGTADTTLTLTIGGPTANTPPVANDDAVGTNEDTPVNIPVRANDTDVDLDTLTITGHSAASFGTVSCSATACSYTPHANAHGTDTFTYTVADGSGGTDSATVTVTVAAVNDPPRFTAASRNTGQTIPVGGALQSLAATDADGDPLTYTRVSGQLPPGITLTSGGAFTGTANAPGTYVVTITVSDGNGGTDTTTLTITVGGPTANTAPVADNDAASTFEDVPVNVDVLGNDVDVDLDTLTITGHSAAAFGTVSCSATACSYTPNANFFGTDSFSYTVADGSGGTDTATVTITVVAVNDPPAYTSAARNTSQTVPVFGTLQSLVATDTENSPLTYTLVSGTLPPGITLTSGGAFTGTANAPGTYVVVIRVSDGNGGTDDTTLTLTIGGPTANTPPVANDDAVGTNEDVPVNIPVRANDTDVDLDTLSVVAHTDPSFGTVSCTATACTYTPGPNFFGTDSFTYTVSDGSGGTDTAVVTVTVASVNDAPVAVNDARTTAEDTTLVMSALRNNDTDIDGDPLTITSFTQPAHGTVSCTATTCTYTPHADYAGSDSFTYTVSDGRGGTSTATVTMTVTAVNDAPVARDDARATAEDTPVVIAVTSNDDDVEANPLTVVGHTPGSFGTVSCGTTSCTYTPGPNFHGSDSFSYTISDGAGGTATATVIVTITAVNDAPVAGADTVTTDEDTAAGVPVLSNDSDVDGDFLLVLSHTQPAHGTVTCTASGCTYTPHANYHGPDSFTYTVSDGAGGTDTETVTITVNSVNDLPVANPDLATTAEDNAVTVAVTGNDTDLDADLLTVISWTQGAHGTVTCSGGTCTYAPDENYHGPDQFAYTVSDGNGGTATSLVDVDVTSVNDAPVATGEVVDTVEDHHVLVDVLGNDTDVDGDTLTVASWSNGAHGTVECLPAGCRYTPAPDYNGPDSFTYTVSDGNGGTATETVTITVVGDNDAPIAVPDGATVDEDGTVDVDVILNDTDVDLDLLAIADWSQGAHGAVTCTASVCTYTPDADFNGTDTFGYVVSDGNGGLTSGLVTVVVNAVNDAPVAVDDTATTDEDTPTIVAVLSNDSDVDLDVLTVSVTVEPLHGTVACDGTVCTYTPEPNYNGTDSFSYLIADGAGGVATATVALTVTAVNDAPAAIDDTADVVGGERVFITVLANDADADGDALTIVGKTNGAHGTVTCSATRCVYRADEDFAGTDSFTYTISDGNGGTTVGRVVVTVAAAPKPPPPPVPPDPPQPGPPVDPGDLPPTDVGGVGGERPPFGLPDTGGDWAALLWLALGLVAAGYAADRYGRRAAF